MQQRKKPRSERVSINRSSVLSLRSSRHPIHVFFVETLSILAAADAAGTKCAEG